MKTAAFDQGTRDALRHLGLLFLGSATVGAGGYWANRVLEDPLEENRPVPRRTDLLSAREQ